MSPAISSPPGPMSPAIPVPPERYAHRRGERSPGVGRSTISSVAERGGHPIGREIRLSGLGIGLDALNVTVPPEWKRVTAIDDGHIQELAHTLRPRATSSPQSMRTSVMARGHDRHPPERRLPRILTPRDARSTPVATRSRGRHGLDRVDTDRSP